MASTRVLGHPKRHHAQIRWLQQQDGTTRPPEALLHATVAPVMFGEPLLNNVLAFDHVQLQK